MVGRSKIVEISRNMPSADTAPADMEGGEEMIAAVKPDGEEPHIEAEVAETAVYESYDGQEWEDAETVAPRRWKTLLTGTFLVALFLAWTGFWGWAYQAELLAPAAPARIAELIGLWAIPTSLIALGWLLAMRLSSTEARRFGDVATLLRTESEALETRIKAVNGEISLARSFLAENARELESIGRSSAQRLTEAAQQLVTALSDSDQKAQVLQNASSAAITNLDLLRDHLPVVTSAAKDATNQIGNAGNSASDQVRSLVAALQSMDEAMEISSRTMNRLEKQTSDTSLRIGNAASEASAALEQSTADSESRTEVLLAKLQSDVAGIEQRLAAAAENIEALSSANAERLAEQAEQLRGTVQSIADAAEAQDSHVSGIVSRLEGSLDSSQAKLDEIDRQATDRFEKLISGLTGSMDDCDAKLSAIDTDATDRIVKLAFAINAVSESSNALTQNLSGSEQRAAAMLGSAKELQTALESISHELADYMPAAFAGLQQSLVDSNSTIQTLRVESQALESQSASLAARLTELDALLASQRTSIQALSDDSDTSLEQRRREVEALSESLNSTHALITDVAATAETHLSGSLQRVAEAAHEAANNSKAIIETGLADISGRLSEQNKALLSGAIDAQLAGLGSAVNEAISRNLTLSEEATQRVSDQLRSVSELTANLEQRAASAREQFDGIDDEAFARRIALLTESLNSASIDVAKILSNEVTDTAWAAYLKGDRGVFTRRAVRLLDSGEAKIIAHQYDDDHEFREHVNRYIHDFEAMMRVLLSTRDGNAIGVTLLSSDVGKLYVALAQAIDRLRN